MNHKIPRSAEGESMEFLFWLVVCLVIIGGIFGAIMSIVDDTWFSNDSLQYIAVSAFCGFATALIVILASLIITRLDLDKYEKYKDVCESMLVSDCDTYVEWVRPHMDIMNECMRLTDGLGTTEHHALAICLQNAEISPKDWENNQ